MNPKFERFLARFPLMESGLIVRKEPKEAYARVIRLFERAGFYIAAADSKLMRFCAYRRGRQYNCTCMHVIWVRPDRDSAYVHYGIEPRHRLFSFCSCRDHEEKIDQCGRAVCKAIDEVAPINGPAFEVANGSRW